LVTKKNNQSCFKNNENNILDLLINCVLIIDFNNLGGGTTFFINTIVSKYKKYNNFLILRFDGNKYCLNLNEECLINFFCYDEIINILEKYKDKIKKIFINHFLGFKDTFIQKILELNIFKIGITHDYYNILINPQPTFNNIKNEQLNTNININKFDLIISQNEINTTFFSKYYKNKTHNVVLPDFFNKLEKVENTYDGKTIVCCMIGYISDIKGNDKLKKIVQICMNNKEKIKFVIFGSSNVKFTESYPYNNIIELNNLLKKHKPNVIIELSQWPETYSYTLTLSMITDLPILYLEKPINSVVENRLNTYNKSHKIRNLVDMIISIKTNFQNYLYTIEPVLRYDMFWNNLFVNEKEK